MTGCPECTWCALSSDHHGDCDCPPHDCALSGSFSPDKEGGIA